MKETLISNMRLLLLPSEAGGQDWNELSREVDDFVTREGLDLAEESVFILFDRAPAAVAEGEGQVRVGRSVIGPRKEYPSPFLVEDFVSASVFLQELEDKHWDGVLAVSQGLWEELQRRGQLRSSSFIIKLSRRLGPQLTLKTEVFFPV